MNAEDRFNMFQCVFLFSFLPIMTYDLLAHPSGNSPLWALAPLIAWFLLTWFVFIRGLK